jgi:hypothetical protein
VSAFKTAQIEKMCQSVVTPNIPLVGTVTLRLEAGTEPKHQVTADNLYIDVADLSANAKFEDIDIGVAAGSMKGGPGPGMKGGSEVADPNGFGQQAKSVQLTDVKQTAWATTAGTFTLPNLTMKLKKGSGAGVECY